MRKQYHLRPSKAGLLAWDIDKLISLTAELTAIDYPLSEIAELNENYWYQFDDEQPTSKSIAEHFKLMQAADLAYPIILCPEGKLMDGMHRVIKAYIAGHKYISAYRLPSLPAADFVNLEPRQLPY